MILGLNESESQHVAKVLRLKKTPNNPKGAASLAAAIREQLDIHTVVIHPIQYAAGADAQGETFVNGPFTATPKISTGAGDHFNAGFVIGRLLGLGVAHSLQLAVAASGFYVRHAVSPNRAALVVDVGLANQFLPRTHDLRRLMAIERISRHSRWFKVGHEVQLKRAAIPSLSRDQTHFR